MYPLTFFTDNLAYLWLLLAFLQLADGWTTWQVIRFGGHEADKLMLWFMSIFGTYWALVVTKVLVVAVTWYFIEQLPAWLMVGLVVMFSAVVTNNVIVLNKQKGR